MNRKFLLAMFGIIFLSAVNLFSATVRTIEVECPIGGEKFEAEIVGSGFISGQRTDLKSVGAVISPPPLPVCPTNKFVLFHPSFYYPYYSQENPYDVPTEYEMKVFSEIIQGKEYRSIPSNAPSYYYLGKFFELLEKHGDRNVRRKGPEVIAFTYLQASWQEEKEGPLRKEILEKSLHHYETFLKGNEGTSEERLNAAILEGELNRLLGNFEKSGKIFRKLKNNKDIRKNSFLKILVDFQLQLIKSRNSHPEEIPYEKMKKSDDIKKISISGLAIVSLGAAGIIIRKRRRASQDEKAEGKKI